MPTDTERMDWLDRLDYADVRQVPTQDPHEPRKPSGLLRAGQFQLYTMVSEHTYGKTVREAIDAGMARATLRPIIDSIRQRLHFQRERPASVPDVNVLEVSQEELDALEAWTLPELRFVQKDTGDFKPAQPHNFGDVRFRLMKPKGKVK